MIEVVLLVLARNVCHLDVSGGLVHLVGTLQFALGAVHGLILDHSCSGEGIRVMSSASGGRRAQLRTLVDASHQAKDADSWCTGNRQFSGSISEAIRHMEYAGHNTTSKSQEHDRTSHDPTRQKDPLPLVLQLYAQRCL